MFEGRGSRDDDVVVLSHGDGGRLTRELVHGLFYPAFRTKAVYADGDSAILHLTDGRIAFSTDSFVVRPLFFCGGDIGKLAVYGTANDLIVCGAAPLWLSAAFIITEGLAVKTLSDVAQSMGEAAQRIGVTIVAGDTKVVEGPDPENLYINTTGIGRVAPGVSLGARRIGPGDSVLITGSIGDHGAAVLAARLGIDRDESPSSDCAPLSFLMEVLTPHLAEVKMMRDPTRGGLATCLKELALLAEVDIWLDEASVSIEPRVRAVTEILGVDPFYLPSEGRAVIVVEEGALEGVLQALRAHPQGAAAAAIGRVRRGSGNVYLKTAAGGTRPLHMLAGTPLPRIC